MLLRFRFLQEQPGHLSNPKSLPYLDFRLPLAKYLIRLRSGEVLSPS